MPKINKKIKGSQLPTYYKFLDEELDEIIENQHQHTKTLNIRSKILGKHTKMLINIEGVFNNDLKESSIAAFKNNSIIENYNKILYYAARGHAHLQDIKTSLSKVESTLDRHGNSFKYLVSEFK